MHRSHQYLYTLQSLVSFYSNTNLFWALWLIFLRMQLDCGAPTTVGTFCTVNNRSVETVKTIYGLQNFYFFFLQNNLYVLWRKVFSLDFVCRPVGDHTRHFDGDRPTFPGDHYTHRSVTDGS